jgi:predicted small secreted protein
MTKHRRVRFGALVITTAALVVAGCGSSSGSSKSTSQPATSSAAAASTAAATSTAAAATTTATHSVPVAKFYSREKALTVAYNAAAQRYQQALKTAGSNISAVATATKAVQQATTTYADGIATLTPPAARAAMVARFVVVLRKFAADQGSFISAAYAKSQARVTAAGVAIRADDVQIKLLGNQLS